VCPIDKFLLGSAMKRAWRDTALFIVPAGFLGPAHEERALKPNPILSPK
jgi:hypothetical protein